MAPLPLPPRLISASACAWWCARPRQGGFWRRGFKRAQFAFHDTTLSMFKTPGAYQRAAQAPSDTTTAAAAASSRAPPAAWTVDVHGLSLAVQPPLRTSRELNCIHFRQAFQPVLEKTRATSGLETGCAMHKGPAVMGGGPLESVFCFAIQTVVKSTEIYGFLHVLTQQWR